MFPLTPTSNLDAHHVLPGRSKSFCSTTSPWPKITWLRNSEEMASGKWRESRGWCTRGFGFFFRRVVVCGWRCDFLDRSESFYKVYISYKDVISDEVNMATKLNMYLYLNIYIYTIYCSVCFRNELHQLIQSQTGSCWRALWSQEKSWLVNNRILSLVLLFKKPMTTTG